MWDDEEDARAAEAEYWAREDDYRHELAITQHLEDLERDEEEAERRARLE